VEELFKRAGFRMTDMDAFAAASGPGSFTGVRVGLTTVKAWGEVYQKPVVGVSRLKARAAEARVGPGYVAAWFDAHRGQVFGAVYKSSDSDLVRVGDEMVIAPEKFLEAVSEVTGGDRVTWASPDPETLFGDAEVEKRRKRGEEFEHVAGLLAGPIGALAARELAAGRFTDPLGLDANYVRRSDAEIFWKGAAMATELQRERTSAFVRVLRPEDAAAVTEILRQSPEAVFWPEASVKEVLEWKGTLGLACEAAGRVEGFLIGRQTGDEAEVLNLAVAPGGRRRGEGAALLSAAVEESRARGVRRVFLEVRESNAAGISFYAKHSFFQAGRRDGYYRDPIEAAIVMEIRLTE